MNHWFFSCGKRVIPDSIDSDVSHSIENVTCLDCLKEVCDDIYIHTTLDSFAHTAKLTYNKIKALNDYNEDFKTLIDKKE